ncbi:hypothetical protein ACIBIZ_43425 [Nonomuraea spiralis]|uniref:hypothetical protein n=1 Tax=Nonomuraea TaxID=83681 RepID=UPI000F77E48E|nr:hypothetical protein [Nonomuraea sp. WAC 01424]
MMRRLAAALAAAAVGATMVATAATPALADPDPDPDFAGGRTSLQLDVNPEPARRGRPVTIEGKLSVACDEDYINGFVSVLHADYCKDSERWHRLGWKRVEILFQADGSNKWEYVESVRTSRDGSFRTGERAYTSGTWRAVFEGSRYLAPSEAKDWVKVYGGRH